MNLMMNCKRFLLIFLVLKSFGGVCQSFNSDLDNGRSGVNIYSIDFGIAIPTGATKKFDINQSWEDAYGMKAGIYLSVSASRYFDVSADFMFGFYTQFGLQLNAMNDEYERFGYESTDLTTRSNLRLEYELGPSISIPINNDINIDAYVKGGLAIISAPYIFNEFDSDFDVNLGDAFGFVYGFGGRLRLSFISVGVDFNPGSLNFQDDFQDFTSRQLPISNVRILFGYLF